MTYYAGLASAMIALVFLYYSAWIFIYGGELNAAIARAREGGVAGGAIALKRQADCRLSSGIDAASMHVVEIAQARCAAR